MTIPISEYLEGRENNDGYCLNCKDWTRDMTEPDAENCKCPCCSKLEVCGAEMLLIMGLVEEEEELSDNDLNNLDPIGYAVMNYEKAANNQTQQPVEPIIDVVEIATPEGKEAIEKSAVFNDWLAIVPLSESLLSITHVPTGMRSGNVSSDYVKPLLSALAIITAYIPVSEELLSEDPETATKAVKEPLMAINAMLSCWANSDTEALVGVFWRDRQAVENRLIDLGLPQDQAEQLAWLRIE